MSRCNCLGGITIITDEPCSTACVNCFIPVNHVVSAADRVAPCGGSDIINIGALNDFTTTCTGNVFYSLSSFDTDAFSSVTITAGGTLTYVFSSDATPGSHYSITYRVRCDNENVGGYGVVLTSPLDLCVPSNCTPAQTCDKCTGDCENIAVDLSVNIQ